jgi:hypothetical protein
MLLMDYNIDDKEVLGGEMSIYVTVSCPNWNAYEKPSQEWLDELR